jgi:hypothetical protein
MHRRIAFWDAMVRGDKSSAKCWNMVFGGVLLVSESSVAWRNVRDPATRGIVNAVRRVGYDRPL